MPHRINPGSSQGPVRQVARKSTAKPPRNLRPPSPPPPTIEIITVDSDSDEEEVEGGIEVKAETPDRPHAEVEVGEPPRNTEPTVVERELSESGNEGEGLIILRPEPCVIKSDPEEPGSSSDTRSSISSESSRSANGSNGNDQDQREVSPPPSGILVLNEFEDDQSEAQRTLQEAFAERRKIQEARWRCKQEGIPVKDPNASQRWPHRVNIPNIAVTFRNRNQTHSGREPGKGHPGRPTPLQPRAYVSRERQRLQKILSRSTSSASSSSTVPVPRARAQPPNAEDTTDAFLRERRKMHENRQRMQRLQESVRAQRQTVDTGGLLGSVWVSETGLVSGYLDSGVQQYEESVLPIPISDQIPPNQNETNTELGVQVESPRATDESSPPEEMEDSDQEEEVFAWEEIPPIFNTEETENNHDCPGEGAELEGTQETAEDSLRKLRKAQEERWRQSQPGPSSASTASTSSTASTTPVPVVEVPVRAESQSNSESEDALRERRRMQENRWKELKRTGVRVQPGPPKKKRSPDARANQEIQWFQRNNDPLIPEDQFAAIAGGMAQTVRRSNRTVKFSGRGNRVLQNGVERFISGMLSDANALAESTGRKTIKGKDVALALKLARNRR